jgi:Flp pilus assembly protein TadD
MAPDRVSGWIHKAISVRRANGGGFESAKALLLEAAQLFPEDDTVQYNLACYCAQLGQLDAAQKQAKIPKPQVSPRMQKNQRLLTYQILSLEKF